VQKKSLTTARAECRPRSRISSRTSSCEHLKIFSINSFFNPLFMNVLIRADASVTIGSGHVMRCATLATELRSRGAFVSFACRAHDGNLIAMLRSQGFEVLELPLAAEQQTHSHKSHESHESHEFHESHDSYEQWLGVPWQRDAEQTAEAASEAASETASETASARHWDWLVVDHYGIDARWHRHWRKHWREHWENDSQKKTDSPTSPKILCVDDIANRPLDCDIVLDQNLYDAPEERYAPLVPPHTRLLLGPHYALLREEFVAIRSEALADRERMQHETGRATTLNVTTLNATTLNATTLNVFFGGSDPTNETAKAVEALKILASENNETGENALAFSADVIVGIANPHKQDVERRCSELAALRPRTHAGEPFVRFHCQVPAMAAFMRRADLALGAGGSTTWERCCLGLPTLAIIIAENQRAMTETAARHGVQWSLGWHEDVRAEHIAAAIRRVLASPDGRASLARVSKAAQTLVDGRGVGRVADAMLAASV
jgi:UDP-2,4-diacetamido-2,4,6-trideoxy-beta-L-altropyranose hydrolase